MAEILNCRWLNTYLNCKIIKNIGSKKMPDKNLKKILASLKAKEHKFDGTYFVPTLWSYIGEEPSQNIYNENVNPYTFFIRHIEKIMSYPESLKNTPCNIESAYIYNIFPRLTLAFDHNQDGEIGGLPGDITLNQYKIRETGTFLKCIALLGHCKRLKTNIIHLLPVTSIGKDGNKGELGSPYAIKNPYKLDEHLKDTLIEDDVETQFKAFIEAAHLLGIKVIAEFVFRTASKDADWVKENPEWFYWIDENVSNRLAGDATEEYLKKTYGPPYFDKQTLEIITQKVKNGDLTDLPAPGDFYKDIFMLPPKKEKIFMNSQGQYRGISINAKNGSEMITKIPGAFADWPPDDIQPPWSDVTYLRMYNDKDPEKPEYNYIAYNTIRMYDENLAKDENENTPLWKKIEGIIPHWSKEFGIDGVMVDMGHAIPVKLMQAIINTARKNNPDFIFLSENFTINSRSLEEGYNAVMGYAWSVWHKENGIKDFLRHVGEEGVPISYFATPENHNTPRAADRFGKKEYSKLAYLLSCFIPHGIPFIHAGFELGETRPVNTGLDFTPEEQKKYSELPLFDKGSLNWEVQRETVDFVIKVSEFRKKYENIITNQENLKYKPISLEPYQMVSYTCKTNDGEIIAILNPTENSYDFSVNEAIFSEINNAEKFFMEGFKCISDGKFLKGHAKPYTGGIIIKTA